MNRFLNLGRSSKNGFGFLFRFWLLLGFALCAAETAFIIACEFAAHS
jgi:hypothetical protein